MTKKDFLTFTAEFIHIANVVTIAVAAAN